MGFGNWETKRLADDTAEMLGPGFCILALSYLAELFWLFEKLLAWMIWTSCLRPSSIQISWNIDAYAPVILEIILPDQRVFKVHGSSRAYGFMQGWHPPDVDDHLIFHEIWISTIVK